MRLNSGAVEPGLRREIRIIAEDPSLPHLPIIEEDGQASALVWPGIGAHMRSMHRISLEAGGRTVSLRHPMEAVYYVISGELNVEDLDTRAKHRVGPGGMFLVDPSTGYRMWAGSDGSELVGGPCPADPAVYEGMRTG
ncbi:MAG TPA: cupin domain-containing protein [Acidimicrobiia bacterium]|nr:cupin domain-containing protein [Acidimicrobiia bacterium]